MPKPNYPLIIIVLLALVGAGSVLNQLLASGAPLGDAALFALLAGLVRFVLFSVLFWVGRGCWRLVKRARQRLVRLASPPTL